MDEGTVNRGYIDQRGNNVRKNEKKSNLHFSLKHYQYMNGASHFNVYILIIIEICTKTKLCS